MNRFELWAFKHELKTFLKKEMKMKPLPKWVGYLTVLAGLLVPGGALFGLIPVKVAAIVGGVATLIANVTHSLPGTGGTPSNP